MLAECSERVKTTAQLHPPSDLVGFSARLLPSVCLCVCVFVCVCVCVFFFSVGLLAANGSEVEVVKVRLTVPASVSLGFCSKYSVFLFVR